MKNKMLKIGRILTTLIIYLTTVQCSTVLIADFSMSRMVELTTREPYCHVHTDRGTIRSMLLGADQRRVRQMSDNSIAKLVNVCRNKQVVSAHQGGFIYPGTKWCGPGDIAKNYSDLGYHVKEDTCCREHDNCPKFLDSKECRKGICNNSPFTRSHCDCDAAFRRCLQNVNSETANTIGAIFFNVVQVICFKERSPCSQWQNSRSRNTDDNINNNKIFNDIPIVNHLVENKLAPNCSIKFEKSARYLPAKRPMFSWRSKREFFINILFRKLRVL